MALGKSGRIVIEIPEDLKKKLYSKLALSGTNLKTWFIQQAEQWLEKKTVSKNENSNEK